MATQHICNEVMIGEWMGSIRHLQNHATIIDTNDSIPYECGDRILQIIILINQKFHQLMQGVYLKKKNQYRICKFHGVIQ